MALAVSHCDEISVRKLGQVPYAAESLREAVERLRLLRSGRSWLESLVPQQPREGGRRVPSPFRGGTEGPHRFPSSPKVTRLQCRRRARELSRPFRVLLPKSLAAACGGCRWFMGGYGAPQAAPPLCSPVVPENAHRFLRRFLARRSWRATHTPVCTHQAFPPDPNLRGVHRDSNRRLSRPSGLRGRSRTDWARAHVRCEDAALPKTALTDAPQTVQLQWADALPLREGPCLGAAVPRTPWMCRLSWPLASTLPGALHVRVTQISKPRCSRVTATSTFPVLSECRNHKVGFVSISVLPFWRRTEVGCGFCCLRGRETSSDS
ncbi:uncharacterized protein LOC104859139 [Fukomys damarensis]|uniref:uncharacterized protein LOC104859139 n=1 Tax=Fukomys damarensis TaxID=885580 RepID=UPI00053F682E|nr:uncharacterized protein LOC104859139 [Fukomys damarensis]